MKCNFIILFFLLQGISAAMAQGATLHGRVADEQQQAVPFATIRLLNSSDSTYIQGCSTDSVGQYRLEVA